MDANSYVITYDVGTTGVKTCLFSIADKIHLIESAYEGYALYLTENGGAEQNVDEWWAAICSTTKRVLHNAGLPPQSICAVSFCSQMQGLVLVDKNGNPVRRAMSYMDSRASKQFKTGMSHGLQIKGLNLYKLIQSLRITKAVAASVKDPVWKYNWIKENEPENFSRVYKWLDVKDYLVLRFSGAFTMTEDSAYATLLYDTRPGKSIWSNTLCKLFGVDRCHLPDVIKSTDLAGKITEAAALELGLAPGTAVYGGGGDAVLIGVGAGAIKLGDTHIYLGTSGWVSTVTDRQLVDTSTMIAAIVGLRNGYFHYFAEMETAGKCLEWVKDHLALDEIGIYLEKKNVTESLEKIYSSLYDYLCDVVRQVPSGSTGVVFAPWFHGNRCPFEDANARGIFFNIGLETGKSALIRAVIEGSFYHCRWMLEAQEKKIKTSDTILFVGGGASSPVPCQILADVIGRDVVTVENPQNVGAVGAAVVIAVGMKRIASFDDASDLIVTNGIYHPVAQNKAAHDKNFKVFKKLYASNRLNFAILNANKLTGSPSKV